VHFFHANTIGGRREDAAGPPLPPAPPWQTVLAGGRFDLVDRTPLP
jgi:hypothetical protein